MCTWQSESGGCRARSGRAAGAKKIGGSLRSPRRGGSFWRMGGAPPRPVWGTLVEVPIRLEPGRHPLLRLLQTNRASGISNVARRDRSIHARVRQATQLLHARRSTPAENAEKETMDSVEQMNAHGMNAEDPPATLAKDFFSNVFSQLDVDFVVRCSKPLPPGTADRNDAPPRGSRARTTAMQSDEA